MHQNTRTALTAQRLFITRAASSQLGIAGIDGAGYVTEYEQVYLLMDTRQRWKE
jgi:hypothetical protein